MHNAKQLVLVPSASDETSKAFGTSKGKTLHIAQLAHKRMKKQLIICIVAMLSGCMSQQRPVVSNPQTYLSALKTLELNRDKYKTYQEYYDAVQGHMTDWLNQIDNPEQLRTLFWSCHSVWQAKPEVPQSQLQWIDPYWESKNLILYRLAEVQTPEAAKVLVELWCDPKAGWDAAPGEMAADAVVKCGKSALPYLKKINSRNANELIELIESGSKTTF
jgi:hypothetical protein